MPKPLKILPKDAKKSKPKVEKVDNKVVVTPEGARKKIVASSPKVQAPSGGKRREGGSTDRIYGVRKTDSRISQYGVSVGWDKDGFFVYTHRARSKSYPSQEKIPLKALKFIDSTG